MSDDSRLEEVGSSDEYRMLSARKEQWSIAAARGGKKHQRPFFVNSKQKHSRELAQIMRAEPTDDSGYHTLI